MIPRAPCADWLDLLPSARLQKCLMPSPALEEQHGCKGAGQHWQAICMTCITHLPSLGQVQLSHCKLAFKGMCRVRHVLFMSAIKQAGTYCLQYSTAQTSAAQNVRLIEENFLKGRSYAVSPCLCGTGQQCLHRGRHPVLNAEPWAARRPDWAALQLQSRQQQNGRLWPCGMITLQDGLANLLPCLSDGIHLPR